MLLVLKCQLQDNNFAAKLLIQLDNIQVGK